MSLGVFILEALDGNMRIYLRCCERAVPQHLLHAPQIGARIKEVRSERMAQLMRSDVGREFGLGEPFLHPALHLA